MSGAGAAEGFAALLRRHREQAGLSCNEVARAAAIDPSYESRLERNERDPPRRVVVIALAEALGLTGAARVRLFTAAGYWPDDALLGAQLHAAARVLAAVQALLPAEEGGDG